MLLLRYNSLSTTRSHTERMKIVEELYSRYYDKVMENPKAHGFDVVSCTVRISKKSTK